MDRRFTLVRIPKQPLRSLTSLTILSGRNQPTAENQESEKVQQATLHRRRVRTGGRYRHVHEFREVIGIVERYFFRRKTA